MERMSFPVLWRKWIKECVSTATASILVNGSPTDEFPLERGLHQGDPLSPFIFLLAAEGLNIIIKSVVARNIFEGYKVGAPASVPVTHLQFADDTLILGVKSWANVRAMRAILVLFETMSGLKVNFNKSMLVGVNVSDSWLFEAASVLHCRVGRVSFMYLGLSIGGDPRRLIFWEPLLRSIKSRLSGFNSQFLSFGGRKLSWVSWTTICSRREYGGLGVREFNIALLGKWCWRLLVERSSLWYRVLVARYGEEDGRLAVGGRRVPFRVRFRRLFDLAIDKSCTVAHMFSSGWDVGGVGWRWSRRLWVWEEEMLGECTILLRNVSLQIGVRDTWRWLLDHSTGYTISSAYQLLTSQDIPQVEGAPALRLLRNRLPTRQNLVHRGILSDTAAGCLLGCGAVETSQHLFISCDFYGSLWSLVRAWLGVSRPDPCFVSDHFLQFTHSAGSSIDQLLDKVKWHSLWWLKASHAVFVFGSDLWWSRPLDCLGLG
ncbi:uncharacterized protein [Medicago truncatula]|uniref:uncharacterized protein n=1 Tax=Medicago truncatula TaxID=3880 RepID=UPI000D2F306A|nr:uncharacterized protein LOC112420043 [Medicago truncatula]